MLPTLYEIASEYKSDLEKLANLDLPPETVRDTLEGMSGALEAKATNIASLVRNLEVTANAIKEAEAQMATRRKALENRIEAIKTYTLNVMLHNDIKAIETPYFKLSVAKNPPRVDVYDESQVPNHFYKTPPPPAPVIDKQAIKESLAHGEDVAGCRLEQGLRLSIK